jgi:prepilin-type N-terminal cleavage/methylation domain-containing protein
MKKKAFTLIELVVVMSIISLLLSIMAVRFDLVKKAKERNELASLVADMNYCKEKSRITGFDHEFVIDGPKSYIINKLTVNNTNMTIRQVRKRVDLEVLEFVDYKLAKDNPDKVIFSFVSTGSTSSPGSVEIKGLSSSYVLSIGVAGASIQITKE